MDDVLFLPLYTVYTGNGQECGLSTDNLNNQDRVRANFVNTNTS